MCLEQTVGTDKGFEEATNGVLKRSKQHVKGILVK